MSAAVIVILIWGLIPAIAGAFVADARGRSPLGWAALCFLFGFVGVLIVAVIPKITPPPAQTSWLSQLEEAERPQAVLQQRPSPAVLPATTMTSDLQQLTSMHERGALSADEFAAAKARVLDGIVNVPVEAAPPSAQAVPVDHVMCGCGTRNRLNRTSCWGCSAPLELPGGATA